MAHKENLRETCLRVYEEGNPIPAIDNLIEQHSYEYLLNTSTMEVERVKKSTPYEECKNPDCVFCKLIEQYAAKLYHYSLGKTAQYRLDELSFQHFAKLLKMGLSFKDIASFFQTDLKEVQQIYRYLLMKIGKEAAFNIFREYDFSTTKAIGLAKLSQEELKEIKKRKDTENLLKAHVKVSERGAL